MRYEFLIKIQWYSYSQTYCGEDGGIHEKYFDRARRFRDYCEAARYILDILKNWLDPNEPATVTIEPVSSNPDWTFEEILASAG